MKKNNRGFTVMELLIVVAIIGVVVVIGGGLIFRSCASSQSSAEAEAMKYGRSLGLDVKGVACTSQDTDGDGYVSCSISHTENGAISIMPAECAARWSISNSGCKAQAQKIGIRRRGF